MHHNQGLSERNNAWDDPGCQSPVAWVQDPVPAETKWGNIKNARDGHQNPSNPFSHPPMSPSQAPTPDEGGTDERNITEGNNNRIGTERSELDSSFLPADI